MDKIIKSSFQLVIVFLLGLLIFLSVTPVLAVASPPKVSWNEGPKTIAVGDNLANLNLPEGYLFANAADTLKLMEYWGNIPSNTEIGLVAPNTPKNSWFVVFSYEPLGYVKDDESKSLDKDAILESIKAGTEEDNKQKQAKGTPPLIVTGWQEPPHYDEVSHNLVWAISATVKEDSVVNYNTRKLGRSGVTSINLVASPTELPTLKPELEKLVASYDYVPGKKYSDFIEGSDKVSEVGLAALIAGGVGAAAVKTGILAKILLFLGLGLKKVWILLALGVGGFFARLFGGKKPTKKPEE